MTAKRAIALLLAMVLVLCLLPAAALAASGHKLTVKASAPKTEETTAGALLEVPMTDIFDASGCADATYSLGGDYGATTSVKPDKDGNWTLYFTQGEARDYSVVLNAVCGSDASVSATHTLTVTVKAAAAGDEEQYNYDETPAKSVTVYVTVSNDGIPLQGNDPDKTALSHLKVTVPYFDLRDYGSGSAPMNVCFAHGQAIARQILREDEIPDAVYCESDLIALGILGELLEAGIDVPGRISLIGHDGLDMCRCLYPRITTIVVPQYAAGQAAAACLLRRLGGKSGHQNLELEPSVFSGDTTRE